MSHYFLLKILTQWFTLRHAFGSIYQHIATFKKWSSSFVVQLSIQKDSFYQTLGNTAMIRASIAFFWTIFFFLQSAFRNVATTAFLWWDAIRDLCIAQIFLGLFRQCLEKKNVFRNRKSISYLSYKTEQNLRNCKFWNHFWKWSCYQSVA